MGLISALLNYDFLVLALLFTVPPVIMLAWRWDLWPLAKLVLWMSWPFALTEPLFYPEYWSPTFLFDLGRKLGLGIEDFLFVMALGMGAVLAYPVLANRMPEVGASLKLNLRKTCWLGLFIILILTVSLGLDWPLIWSVIVLMLVASGVIMILRRDLLAAGLLGAVFYGLIYFSLCLIFGWIYPDAFHTVWHTQGLSNIFVLEIPIEELGYGLACGLGASVCVPYLFDFRYQKRGS